MVEITDLAFILAILFIIFFFTASGIYITNRKKEKILVDAKWVVMNITWEF